MKYIKITAIISLLAVAGIFSLLNSCKQVQDTSGGYGGAGGGLGSGEAGGSAGGFGGQGSGH